MSDLKKAAAEFLAAVDTGETAASRWLEQKREALRDALGEDAHPTPEVESADAAAQAELDASVPAPAPEVPAA